MNGAETLVKTLLLGEVDVCFANPGTSEMHFVTALDRNSEMRCVLCLFEGVATGAADGYARMKGKPAATLLHLGPGFGNGSANIHNAKKAGSPMINIVGEHASYHLQYDAPLTADIEAIARPFSHWVKTVPEATLVARYGAEAISVANTVPGQIATLILPANTAWEPASEPLKAQPPEAASVVGDNTIETIAGIISGAEPCVMFVGAQALSRQGQRLAAKLATKTGLSLMTPMANARTERGAGCPDIRRVPYVVDKALSTLAPFRHAILVGCKEPVAFFAYPGKPSRLLPEHCQVHVLADSGDDAIGALEQLVDTCSAAASEPMLQRLDPPGVPGGELNAAKIAQAVAALMPEAAIIVDESVSSGREFFQVINHTQPHSWLQITGGSIGIGPPLSAGAAVACPDRKVIVLQADGSAMYTLQGLWTHAREGLDITTIILANRAYRILQGEMRNVGAVPGPVARDLLELQRPALDWVSLARGLGLEAERVESAESMVTALRRGLNSPGPYLIEALI